MVDVGRNSPCPCGSGRRYKECHGGLAQAPPPVPAIVDEGELLRAALDAQRRGAFDDAIERYQAVVAQQPANFDAWHMLGVAQFQKGDLDAARINVRKALTLRPFELAARGNMHLVDMAIDRRSIDDAICRGVLPRLVPRCVAPAASARAANGCEGRAVDRALDLVILRSDVSQSWAPLDRLRQWLDAEPVTLWRNGVAEGPETDRLRARAIGTSSDDRPRAASLVFFGADLAPGAWLASSPAHWIGLYCDEEPAALLVDRIPEISREGQTPVHLLFASAAQAKRIGLPGEVVVSTDRRRGEV